MLEVSKEQFRRSWNRQENTSKTIINDVASRRMLLFYALECGAKYLYMDKNGYRFYKREISKQDRLGHDIKRLLKEFGIESKCQFPDLISNFEETVHPEEYHQMWRYSINCKDADQQGWIIEENMLKARELLHELEMRS